MAGQDRANDELLLMCDVLRQNHWVMPEEGDPEVARLSALLRAMSGGPGADEERSRPEAVRKKLADLLEAAADRTDEPSPEREMLDQFRLFSGDMHFRAELLARNIETGNYDRQPPPLDLREDYDFRLRRAAMEWFDHRRDNGLEVVHRTDRFEFEGREMPLMNWVGGVWKPEFLDTVLSIKTTHRRKRLPQLYTDAMGSDGLQRYEYAPGGPQDASNVALRRTFERQLPLIWLVPSGTEGLYVPRYPVYIVADEPDMQQIALATDAVQIEISARPSTTAAERRYAERIARQRLHQDEFRKQVLSAYDHVCAICGLDYPPLLEAAHIIPDKRPRGEPVVPNGLALCVIHHKAYDANFIGIPPTLRIEVRTDVLHRTGDSSMLQHGLQSMNGMSVHTPRRRADRPDPDRLEERYEIFRRATDG